MSILYFNFNLVNEEFTDFKPDQVMLVEQGLIAWVGSQTSWNKTKDKRKIKQKVDLKGRNMIPAFIECHTHTVFAGSRADEFEERLSGVSYLDIAKKGGGILSTVKQTRQASEKELLDLAQTRVNQFLKQGVATLEIKSGYGLNLETEIKILQVAKKLKGPRIVTTYLGAHAKPKEIKSYKAYLDQIVKNSLPQIKKLKLSNRVDIFIEKNFFESQDAEVFLKACQKLGFKIAIHANQLSHSGGLALALKYEAQSADHVICLKEQDIRNWSKSQKPPVAVLLPLADLYMQCDYPPARKLLDAKIPVALATDFNPGSSPSQDLMLTGLLARLKMQMSLAEVFKAYTLFAAQALGIENEEGSIVKGKRANFILTSAGLSDFFYSAGQVPTLDLYIEGKRV